MHFLYLFLSGIISRPILPDPLLALSLFSPPFFYESHTQGNSSQQRIHIGTPPCSPFGLVVPALFLTELFMYSKTNNRKEKKKSRKHQLSRHTTTTLRGGKNQNQINWAKRKEGKPIKALLLLLLDDVECGGCVQGSMNQQPTISPHQNDSPPDLNPQRVPT